MTQVITPKGGVGKYQQLSCREGGQFDAARKLAGQFHESGWARVSAARAKRGVSRSVRVARRRAA